ncbi:MAG: hypothetical protein QF440_06945 [Candidatus Thalassarchaeaceae archaeon]|jgi:hypothetical protein|nr:hypothetical protein [Candidatus Thalassarchaeaceae archaeon]
MAQAGTVFIRGFEGDWLQFVDCKITVDIRRRITREVKRGGEGDDLQDEGAESAVYTLEGNIGVSGYREVLAIFRSGEVWLLDPFTQDEIKVAFQSLHYEGDNGTYSFELIEDVI